MAKRNDKVAFILAKSVAPQFNFSTTAIGRQLAIDGYLIKPDNRRLTHLERTPGAGRKTSPERVWKFDISKINGLSDWI